MKLLLSLSQPNCFSISLSFDITFSFILQLAGFAFIIYCFISSNILPYLHSLIPIVYNTLNTHYTAIIASIIIIILTIVGYIYFKKPKNNINTDTNIKT